MNQSQCDQMARVLELGLAEMQRRIIRGDEDSQLDALIDAYRAYFARAREITGTDQVPIATYETYEMALRRKALLQ